MQNKLTVSIITVTYNCVKTIRRTIDSVFTQNYENIEYIIIDGESIDGTMDVLNKHKESFTVLISEKDNGIYNAMNKGLSCATGEIVYFLNGDDYLLEDDSISNVVSYYEENRPDLLCCRVYTGEGVSVLRKIEDIDENLKYHAMLPHQGLFAKHSLFSDIGQFNEKYTIAADYEWMLRAFEHHALFQFKDYVVAYYDQNGKSKSDIGIIEQHKVSLDYLNRNLMRREIAIEHKKYIRSIKEWITRKTIDNHPFEIGEVIVDQIPTDKELAIWGGGTWGSRIYKAISTYGKEPSFIIDSNPNEFVKKKWKSLSKEIISYQPEMTLFVINATGISEKTVDSILISNNAINGKDFISLSDIKRKILSFGIEQYNYDLEFVKYGDVMRNDLLEIY